LDVLLALLDFEQEARKVHSRQDYTPMAER
jgi:hypothetical protein